MTNVIAIRVDDYIRNELYKESKKMNISINALVSSILKKYVEWDRFVYRDGFVYIPKEAFNKILSTLYPKDIIELAEITGNELKKLVMFNYGEYTINNLWSILHYWLEASNIQTRTIDKKLLVKHEYETKGTLYIKSLVNNLIGEIEVIIIEDKVS